MGSSRPLVGSGHISMFWVLKSCYKLSLVGVLLVSCKLHRACTELVVVKLIMRLFRTSERSLPGSLGCSCSV